MWNGHVVLWWPHVYLVLAIADAVPCPAVVPDYNQHMGGVDLFDQMGSVYSILRKTYCWPIVFLYNFLETAVLNSYQLYKITTNPKITHRNYVRLLVGELTDAALSSPSLCQLRGDVLLHMGERVATSSRSTILWLLPRKQQGGESEKQFLCPAVYSLMLVFLCRCAVCKYVNFKPRKRLTYCIECGVFLCFKNNDLCYKYFHGRTTKAVECRKLLGDMKREDIIVLVLLGRRIS